MSKKVVTKNNTNNISTKGERSMKKSAFKNKDGITRLSNHVIGTIKKPFYFMVYNPNWEVAISEGNNKLGRIFNINLIPGYEYLTTTTHGVLTNVRGTCGGCCEICENNGCYAVRDAKFRHNSCIPSWGKNTLIMRHDLELYFKQIKNYISKRNKNKAIVEVLRFHSAGEIPSYEYFLGMVNLAKEVPSVTFYCYTKRFQWMLDYKNSGLELPSNMIVNLSRWNNNLDGYEDLSDMKQFAYDDGSDSEVAAMVHCPAVDKKGKSTGITCRQCKRCFNNKAKRTAVYAH